MSIWRGLAPRATLLIGLSSVTGCAALAPTFETEALKRTDRLPLSVPCPALSEVRLSRADTDATIRAVRQQNAVVRTLCAPAPQPRPTP